MFKRIVLILSIIYLSFYITGCSTHSVNDLPSSSIEVIVLSNTNNTISVISLDDHQYYQLLLSDESLQQNDIITIDYSLIQETYPLQIEPINIYKSKTRLISMYLNVIDELLEVDSQLGKGDKILSLTFSDSLQMSGKDISLIHYVLLNRYGYDEIMTMNYDELFENGYIQNDTIPYFKDGLLISITSEDYTNDSFQFNAMKYKSGLAAYIFTNCKATNTTTGWEYQIGQHAIS